MAADRLQSGADQSENYITTLEHWPYAIHKLFERPTDHLIEQHALSQLCRFLAMGRITAFVGSGVSIAYGRLSWASLIDEIKSKVLSKCSDSRYKNEELIKAINDGRADDGANQLTLYQLTRQLYEQCIRAHPDKEPKTFHDLVGELIKDDIGHLSALFRKFVEDGKIVVPAALNLLSKYDEKILKSMDISRPEDWIPQKRYRAIKQNGNKINEPTDLDLEQAEASQRVLRAKRYLPDFDPLKILMENLKIQKFLTTNYDAEIQNAFHDQGYLLDQQQGKGSEILGKGSLPFSPTRYSELIFSKENAAELMVMSTLRRPQASWVLHLHGKAGMGNTQSIIATETDYLARYVHDDRRRFITESAIRQAFGSSPLFFIGIGLGEEDLMRPLREFMSRRPYPVDRAVIAALPRVVKEEDALYKKIKHLQNHGVYVVHYGSATFAGDQGEVHCVDWLSKVGEIIKKMKEVIGDIGKRGASIDTLPKESKSLQNLKSIADVAEKISKRTGKTFRTQKRIKHPWLIDLLDVPELIENIKIGKDAVEVVKNDIAKINRIYSKLIEICTIKVRARRAARQVRAPFIDPAESAVLDCILDNLYTLACTSFLRRIHDIELPKWRRKWLKELRHFRGMESRVTKEPKEHGDVKLHIRSRHAHEKYGESILSPRFSTQILSQTWYRFLSAIRSEQSLGRGHAGRRTFYLAANRGLGKGQIFSEISSEPALELLLSALGVRKGNVYVGIFSFSFSNELVSVLDKIAELMSDAALSDMSGDRKANFGAELRKLKAYRDARLRLAMEHLSRQTNAWTVQKRVLLIINSAATLFDHDGNPKNRQIRSFLEVLFSEKYNNAPLDIILITGAKLVPGITLGNGSSGVRVLATPQALERELRANNKKIEIAKIPVAAHGPHRQFLHFLGSPRVSVIVSSDFPLLGFAIILSALPSEKHLSFSGQFSGLAVRVSGAIRASVQDYDKTYTDGCVDWVSRKTEILKNIFLCTRSAMSPAPANGAGIILGSQPLNADEREKLRHVDENVFKELYRAVGRSRYGLTILLASLEEHFILSCLRAGRDGAPALQVIAREIVRNIEAISADLKFQEPARRDDQIIRLVWEVYRRAERDFGDVLLDGIKLMLELSAGAEAAKEFDREVSHFPKFVANLVQIQLELTWHMAIIGQPVEASVLAACPFVSRLVSQSAKHEGASRPQISVDTLVEQALRVMISRGLVFLVEPARSAAGDKPRRYAIHRFSQRRIFHEMGARYVEYSEVGKLTLSSYASQPNDVPVLTADSHRKVKEAMDALMGYPPALEKSPNEAVNTDGKKCAHKVACIRAAFGIVKTVYSVACIAKLDIRHVDSDAASLEANIKPAGLFEEHRQRLLWLLCAVDGVTSVKAGAEVNLPGNGMIVDAPLYADELVWLYNECGVLSLAQGRSPDARALFRLADRMALRIDEAPEGGLRPLIKLNAASVEIGRGRLAEAENLLKDVVSALDPKFDEEHYLIAVGYLCVIDQLRGHEADLIQKYPDVINALIRLGALRAASTFSRNFAILLSFNARHAGDGISVVGAAANDARRAAISMAEQAVRLAAENGHEDIRQLGLITGISMRIKYDNQISGEEVYRILDAANHYAQAMGIPHLECACAYARAEFHLKNGDYPTAFKAASQSVELATLYDLELRKVSGMRLLAKIALKAGFAKDAGVLARGALTLIDGIGFYAEAAAVQNVLDQIPAISE
jgi:hypothetical protein